MRVHEYAKQYKKQQRKSEQEINIEIEKIEKQGMASLPALQQLISDVRQSIDMLYAPIFVIQATHDEVIDPDSANIIYHSVESNDKHIRWFDESRHVITLDKEKDKLHEAVLTFLNSLDWIV